MNKHPEALFNWSGDKAGGVKKLFYKGSGRPSGVVIKTGLLERLSFWAGEVAKGIDQGPRVIFLVGGPGNGKTEAIEYTIERLDEALGLNSELINELSDLYSGRMGSPGRLVRSVSTEFPASSGIQSIAVVQDGSESERGSALTPAEHLYEDLCSQLSGRDNELYVACVNRGVLDDALILAADRDVKPVGDLLKQIVQAVSLSAASQSCWPLAGHPRFAVWPMDVESLVEEVVGSRRNSAARQILAAATREADWPEFGTCAAGQMCPFCNSRKLLDVEANSTALIRVLRWFELSSGKRWNFRDLFSMVAHILAGGASGKLANAYSPCDWAASQIDPKEKSPVKREIKVARGTFRVVTAQYQHAMFGTWPVERAVALKADLRDLKLEEHPALAGMYQFLALDKRKETTSTLHSQLQGMVTHLDPASASPDLVVELSKNKTIQFKEIDRLFSLSVRGGREMLSRHRCLSPPENEVLKLLEQADEKLSDEATRRRKSGAADRVQALVRLIACRIARRSVGVRFGVTKDANVLKEFSTLLRGDESALQEAKQKVEGLLNKDHRFHVSLNTTFGEPLPPPERRVMLTTTAQRVKQMSLEHDDSRPVPPVRFLSVGSGTSAQPVALTYELFKATISLRSGMVPASLPRSVVALLDTTRAKLAGMVVRDSDSLDECDVRLGLRDELITQNFGKFVVRRGGLS
ncbi:hypothetical protein [Stenotrophomonas rhizophila]|uniref:hypothetical protein n=1 Tax=Stenotrophomonas rhizophila TaxID=216778 RepID=UPI0028D8E188|nr:hypothetical protein [Stenotrophomonas rhizophila]